MGFGRIPGVYSQDPSTPAAQFAVPFLRTLVGIPLSILMSGLGAAWFIWLIPPKSALLIAVFALACGLVTTGWLGLLARAEQVRATDDDAVRLHISRQVSAFLACVGIAALIWGVGGLSKTWWGLPPRTWSAATGNIGLYTTQFMLAIGLFVGGSFGIYWYGKETVTPHELVGEHYIAHEVLEWDKEKYYDQRAWTYEKAELQEEISALKLDLLAAQSRPLVNAAEVSRHQRQPLQWQLAVAQLLLAGEMGLGHSRNSLVPGGSPVHTLPLTGTRVTDAFVRHIYRQLRDIKVADMPVMTSAGNRTGFTAGVPIMLAVGAIERVSVWRGFGS
jgi:hypothetical protein